MQQAKALKVKQVKVICTQNALDTQCSVSVANVKIFKRQLGDTKLQEYNLQEKLE